jgi:formylglycine-generating enzyme required for sulfatase activity
MNDEKLMNDNTAQAEKIIEFTETAIESGDASYPFEFETVRVDRHGNVVKKEQHSGSGFCEPLAPDLGLEMVAIPGGKFMMGSPETEHDRSSCESPQHEVTVPTFFMSKYPITEGQWQIVKNNKQELDPSPFSIEWKRLMKEQELELARSVSPINWLYWEDAVEFCHLLSNQTGRTYRLPTEAEWEYACRAGTATPFHFGETITGKLANYDNYETYLEDQNDEEYNDATLVDNFLPNAFGLCNMHGNEWEWCLDHWHNDYEGAPTDGSAWLSANADPVHILRGGAWNSNPSDCRSAARSNNIEACCYNSGFGFRVVCEIPKT